MALGKRKTFKTLDAVRSGCKGAGIVDTPDNLWSFFISRIKKNLHMSLCFSPVGESMRARARKFPGLVNCTGINNLMPKIKSLKY